ncbi:VanZ family protein [Klenkia sp. LSe6-5]|uniref:VanZ family protein n=1 Tax=Klenkia sesuvii TaxID=3103137 RepID=A0ABU8DYQ7_9ACTN
MALWRASALVAVFLFAVLVAVSFLPWLAGQYRRHGRLRGWPAAVSAAVGLYACGLLGFTLFPLPEGTPGACSRLATWQLVPLDSVRAAWAAGRGDGLLALLTTPSVLQVLLNVALFVPLGLLARWRFGLGAVRTVLLGLAVSAAVEVVQGTAVFGAYACPYRVADVDDVLTNVLGTAVGAALAGPAGRLLPHPSPAPAPDLAPPGLPRRAWAVVVDALTALAATGVVTVSVALGTAALGGGVGALDAVGFERVRSVVGYAVPALLLVVLPLLVRSRATPGQAALGLAVSRPDGGTTAPRWRVLVRALVRWAPPAVLADLGGVLPAAAWLVLPAAFVLLGQDRRSLAGRLSGTATTTRARLVAGTDPSPPAADSPGDAVLGGAADPRREQDGEP